WSPWQKINVQIAARAVSPVVYDGRLHVFWVDVKSKSQNQLSGGTSNFNGYVHTLKLYFTTLRQDGTWTAPQQVQFPTKYGDPTGDSLPIQDPLDVNKAARYDPQLLTESDPVDGYTLSGPNWDRVWLTPTASSLHAQCRNFKDQFELDLFKHKAI